MVCGARWALKREVRALHASVCRRSPILKGAIQRHECRKNHVSQPHRISRPCPAAARLNFPECPLQTHTTCHVSKQICFAPRSIYCAPSDARWHAAPRLQPPCSTRRTLPEQRMQQTSVSLHKQSMNHHELLVYKLMFPLIGANRMCAPGDRRLVMGRSRTPPPRPRVVHAPGPRRYAPHLLHLPATCISGFSDYLILKLLDYKMPRCDERALACVAVKRSSNALLQSHARASP